MELARGKRQRWAFGLLISLGVNALVVCLLALQTPKIRPIADRDERPAINLVLIALPKNPPNAGRPSRQPPGPPGATRDRTPAAEPRSAASAPPALARPAPAQPPPSAAADEDAEVRAKVARALRGMAACAKFEVGPQDRPPSGCGKAWNAPAVAVDPVPQEMRAQHQAEAARSADAVAVGNRFRNDLQDHSKEGNNAHFGCLIDTGGKVKCSTY